jgi:hypothetical protein
VAGRTEVEIAQAANKESLSRGKTNLSKEVMSSSVSQFTRLSIWFHDQ